MHVRLSRLNRAVLQAGSLELGLNISGFASIDCEVHKSDKCANQIAGALLDELRKSARGLNQETSTLVDDALVVHRLGRLWGFLCGLPVLFRSTRFCGRRGSFAVF